MKKVAIIISPNYKDYAEKYLADCALSLRKQDWQGGMKIFITDNETSPESFGLLNKVFIQTGYQVIGEHNCEILNLDSRFRGNDRGEKGGNDRGERISVEIIRNKNNDGFAKGNNDAMRRAIAQGFDYVILFNMDTVVAPDCVRRMVEGAENDNRILDSRFRLPAGKAGGNDKKEIGAVQARLMLWPDKEKVNSLGNSTHFLGFGYCLGYGENWKRLDSRFRWNDKNTNIFYPSGAAVLLKREVLEKVKTSPRPSPSQGEGGYFDEEFWMYNEDQDLGWRIWLAGYRCVLAPEAVACHKYQFAKSIKQYYWMDRNRIIAIIKNYHFLTLLLILPAFVIMELGLILFSLKTGWFKEKMKVWKYFLTPAKWKYLYGARKQVQALRKVKDRDIAKMITGRIWYQEVDDWKLRLINPVFSIYWKAVKLLVKIFNF